MLYLNRLFLPTLYDPQSAALLVAYSGWLVALSVLIAVLAAFVALSISSRVAASRSRFAHMAWISAGACSMGGGIWAMHFIGMLAFSLPCGVRYDVVLTLLSTVPGILASAIALTLIAEPGRIGPRRLLAGAAPRSPPRSMLALGQ